jgi:hypothetical protein
VSLDSRLRARRFVAGNLALLAVVALLVTGAGAALTYDAHFTDRTTTETRTVTAYEPTPSFTHGATVTRENPVFDVGTRLSDRGVYYTRVAPVLDGEFRFGYRAADGTVTVRMTATRVIRGVSEEGERVLWAERQQLASEEVTGLEPGETGAVPFRVNVSEMQSRAGNITEALGASAAGVQTLVAVRVHVTGEAGGATVNTTTSHELRIDAGDGTYSPTANATGTPITRQQTETVNDPPGPLSTAGGPALLALGLLGGLGLAVGARGNRLSLTEDERAVLAHQRARTEFDEWITVASLPGSVVGPTEDHVTVSDLEGLVDVAIDTNGRVIEDEVRGGYFVVNDDLTYRYDPPNADATADDDPLEPAVKRIDET